jgi:hypothetical protein
LFPDKLKVLLHKRVLVVRVCISKYLNERNRTKKGAIITYYIF